MNNNINKKNLIYEKNQTFFITRRAAGDLFYKYGMGMVR